MTFEDLAALGYSRLVPIIPPDAPISARSTLASRVGTRQDGRGNCLSDVWRGCLANLTIRDIS